MQCRARSVITTNDGRQRGNEHRRASVSTTTPRDRRQAAAAMLREGRPARRERRAGHTRQAGPAHGRATRRDLLGHRWLGARSPLGASLVGFSGWRLAKRFPVASLWLWREAGVKETPVPSD